MSAEKLVERLGELADRRNFLKKVGLASVGSVVASLGLSTSAEALHNVGCCHLCHPPSACHPRCAWCWTCCYRPAHGPMLRYNCCEGYGPNGNCTSGNCVGVVCSYTVQVGYC